MSHERKEGIRKRVGGIEKEVSFVKISGNRKTQAE